MTSNIDDQIGYKEETLIPFWKKVTASETTQQKKPHPYSAYFDYAIDLFNFYKEFSVLARYLIISITDEGTVIVNTTNIRENTKDIQRRISNYGDISKSNYGEFIMALDLERCLINQMRLSGINPRTFDLYDQSQREFLIKNPINFSDPKTKTQYRYTRYADSVESGDVIISRPKEVILASDQKPKCE